MDFLRVLRYRKLSETVILPVFLRAVRQLYLLLGEEEVDGLRHLRFEPVP